MYCSFTYHTEMGILCLTVLVLFYATDGPDTPEDLSCETSNFVIIKCTWKPGRASGLYGVRGTKYSLIER